LKTKMSWLICVLLSVIWLRPAWQVAVQAAPAQVAPAQATPTLTPTPTPAPIQAVPARVRITQDIDPAGKDYPKVKLVVSVTDNTGRPVTDLEASAFSVSENQAPVANLLVEMVQSKMAIGFVIDSSGTLAKVEGNAKLVEHAKTVVKDWIAQLQGDDTVGVYAFKGGAATELSPFMVDHGAVSNAVDGIATAGNTKTALFDLVRMAIDAASAQPSGRRVLVIFSDGSDTISSSVVDTAIQDAKDANLVIYTVGLRSDFNLAPDREGSKLLRQLAQETGGEYLWYRPTVKGARAQLDEFLQRMDHQRNLYQLTYDTVQCSGAPNVRLVVTSGGASIETSAIYKIPQHKPEISLDNLVSDREYLGTRETIKASIKCSQSPLTKVEFKINGQTEYTAIVAPFQYDWNTDASAKSLGFPENELRPVQVTVVGYAGAYTAEDSRTVYIQQTTIALPCTTGNSFENFFCELQRGNIIAYITVVGFLLALAAVILLIVFIRRGGIRAVSHVVVESARRVTKTFQHKTRIKGQGGVAAVRSAGLATLILESEPYTGKRIYMEEANAYIGRVPEKADIVFEWDDYLSGRHAKIKCEQGRFFVWDMQSANGTWVNDQRVPKSMSDGVDYNEAREVFDGSIIRLGPDLRLRFKSGTEQEVAAPAAEPVTPPAPPAS
jgi:Ca-activated chloride channel homolog